MSKELTMLELLTEIEKVRKENQALEARVQALEQHNGFVNSVYLDGVAEIYRADILKDLEEKR